MSDYSFIYRHELQKDEDSNVIMSKENLMRMCLKDNLYEYPELNDKIYMHFKGFKKIENLEEYVNLKTLWLENNCIMKI